MLKNRLSDHQYSPKGRVPQGSSLVSLCLGAAVVIACNGAFAQDSIQTVDALLEAENKAVIDKLKMMSQPVELPKPAPQKKVDKPSPPAITVKAVYGVSNTLKTDITYNGSPLVGRIVGAQVGPCAISEIRGSCVILTPRTSVSATSDASAKKGDAKKTSAKAYKVKKGKSEQVAAAPINMCPVTCWTAPPPVFNYAPSGFAGSFPSVGSAPRFEPPVLTGSQRTSTPIVTSGQGIGPAVIPSLAPAQSSPPAAPNTSVRMSTTLSGSSR